MIYGTRERLHRLSPSSAGATTALPARLLLPIGASWLARGAATAAACTAAISSPWRPSARASSPALIRQSQTHVECAAPSRRMTIIVKPGSSSALPVEAASEKVTVTKVVSIAVSAPLEIQSPRRHTPSENQEVIPATTWIAAMMM